MRKLLALLLLAVLVGGFRGGLTTNIALPTHLGVVATGGSIATQIDTTNLQFNSQTCRYFRTSGTSFQISVPNWYVVQGGAETNSGGTLTLFAGANVNGGTLTRITWSSAASTIIADGATVVSDPINIPYSTGQSWCVRFFGTASIGRLYSINRLTTSLGDGLNIGASGLSDLTLGGTITNNSGAHSLDPSSLFLPAAIIGQTAQPTVAIFGDSLCQGQGDTIDTSGDVGTIARSVGPTLAYINECVSSDQAQLFVSSHAKRVALASAYTTTIVNAYGRNDINAGRSAAQIEADMQTIAGYTALPNIITTLAPTSSSTDSWATTVNQTAISNNAARVTYNTAVRAGTAVPSATHFSEIANVIEPVQNDGIWNVTGLANGYTADGVHPNRAMELLIVGTTNPAWIQ